MKINEVESRPEVLWRDQRGGLSIAFAFFAVLIFTTLGVVSYSLMNTENHLSVNFVDLTKAQYLAESGAHYGIMLIFQGQQAPYSETVSIGEDYFFVNMASAEDLIIMTVKGDVGDIEKTLELQINYHPPIGDFAIYSTGDIDNVTALDEAGDPAPHLMQDNAPSLPDIDDDLLIQMATDQGHVYAGDYTPFHGYPNFNFYNTGNIPNVTYIQGDLTVNGGRTVYGIFIVEGNIMLNGSSRVDGVLYMTTPSNVIIHGGGNPTQSSVTGGIIANGDVDGTGNHITVNYHAEYMYKFGEAENIQTAREIIAWKEL